MSAFDPVAPSFDTNRAIPGAALEAVRAAILAAISLATRPRLLDIGAGTGRFGLPFVAAGNDYVGVDMSLGMLLQFAERSPRRVDHVPRLAQSDGRLLPFCDATFDAVMLMNVVGGLRVEWRPLIAEARRVLRPTGALFVGQVVAPASGVNEQMRMRLSFIICSLRKKGVQYDNKRYDKRDARLEVLRHLELAAESSAQVVPAAWEVERTPRSFLERQGSGPRFSALPTPVKEEALSKLSAWAVAKFGSLDAVHSERYVFELRVFKFREDGVNLPAFSVPLS